MAGSSKKFADLESSRLTQQEQPATEADSTGWSEPASQTEVRTAEEVGEIVTDRDHSIYTSTSNADEIPKAILKGSQYRSLRMPGSILGIAASALPLVIVPF